MKIAQLGEKKLIKRLLEKRDAENIHEKVESNVFQSYHDDAAIVLNTKKYTTLSTDMLIEHVHFPKGMTYYQMGAKAVCVNVSDIIAMGTHPEAILISLAIPSGMDVEEFDQLTDGIIDTCNMYDVTLIGGDLNSNDEIIISATALGVTDDNIKLQNNIKPGDLVAVSGNLGSPAAAYDLIYNKDVELEDDMKKVILDSFLNPAVSTDILEIIDKYPDLITGMTDITDGLASELENLCKNNKNIGFNIHLSKIPYDKNIQHIADANNKQLTEYLLYFGEEFEQLFTLNNTQYNEHKNELTNMTIIGKTTDKKSITIEDQDKNIKNMKIKGYEHLRGDS